MVENPIKADKNEDISAKPLTEAAKRALKEAAERKALAEKAKTVQQSEIDGRGGLDPVRFGDWEKKGIAVDF